MTQHIVSLESSVVYFKETDDINDLVFGGTEIWGQADSITEFVKGLRLEQEWIPYGYHLRTVYRNGNSKNMTAYLSRLGERFINRI